MGNVFCPVVFFTQIYLPSLAKKGRAWNKATSVLLPPNPPWRIEPPRLTDLFVREKTQASR